MHIGQERIVDLHIETGINDGFVFLVQRFGERKEVALFIFVVLDFGSRQRARRRYHREKACERGVLLLGLGQTGVDVVDVAADLVLAAIGNRPIDDDAIAQPFAQPGGGVVLGIKFRKRLAVLTA